MIPISVSVLSLNQLRDIWGPLRFSFFIGNARILPSPCTYNYLLLVSSAKSWDLFGFLELLLLAVFVINMKKSFSIVLHHFISLAVSFSVENDNSRLSSVCLVRTNIFILCMYGLEKLIFYFKIRVLLFSAKFVENDLKETETGENCLHLEQPKIVGIHFPRK